MKVMMNEREAEVSHMLYTVMIKVIKERKFKVILWQNSHFRNLRHFEA